MHSEEANSTKSVKPRFFGHYLKKKGWTKTTSKFTDVAVYRGDGEEIVVPMERTLDDFDNLMFNAVQKISFLENRSKEDVISSLSLPVSDVVNFRLVDNATKEGFISLSKGPNFLVACQRALLASACSVEDPKTHYPKLSRSVAKSFLEKCKFNTKTGSFVVNIMCPLSAVDENTITDKAKKYKISPDETFTRSVTRKLMDSVNEVMKAIDSGDNDKLTDPLNPVSSNFCKALLGMCPESENASLIIASEAIDGSPVAPAVSLSSDYFEEIEKLVTKLTPNSEPESRFFTGLITDLHGERTESGKPAGDIEITFQYDDEDIIKARVTLEVDDYAVALKSHGNGHYVSFRGTLIMGARVHKISDIKDFKDLQSG